MGPVKQITLYIPSDYGVSSIASSSGSASLAPSLVLILAPINLSLESELSSSPVVVFGEISYRQQTAG